MEPTGGTSGHGADDFEMERGFLDPVKEWIVCEDNCLKCSYGATLDCDGDCPRCPRNTYCPCVTFVSFAAGKLAPVVQPVAVTFERPGKR